MTGHRGLRVAESVRLWLSTALRRDVGDPRLARAVITDVGVSDDLSVARVAVRLLSDDDVAERRALLRSLRRVRPRLQRGLASQLRLRRVPELRFRYDDGHDAARRVDELLREIDAERGSASSEDELPE